MMVRSLMTLPQDPLGVDDAVKFRAVQLPEIMAAALQDPRYITFVERQNELQQIMRDVVAKRTGCRPSKEQDRLAPHIKNRRVI